MKFVRLICRFIIGAVFVFSGFVKVIDPLGSAYKLTDYFNAFSLGFLEKLSLPLGIVMASFELLLGMVLIFGYRQKITAWVTLVFVSFFTILTLILAIFNPVTDCGCFGDAVIMTNWETFFKNLVLILLTIILFSGRNQPVKHESPWYEWSVVVLIFSGGVLLSAMCLRHLPLIDFRPYNVGTNIKHEMEIPEDAPSDEYETILYYKNLESGKIEQFTISNYPKDTLKWKFDDSESKLISKGYEPLIHDFSIQDEFGNNLAEEILDDQDYSLIMVIYNIGKSSDNGLVKANEWSGLSKIAEDLSFYAVTASADDDIYEKSQNLNLGYNFYSADEIMLKTTIRSNPGFILIRNGVIVGKWGWRDMISIQELDSSWPELVDQTDQQMNEEDLILMEEGLFEEYNLDLVEFDLAATEFVFSEVEKNSARLVSWMHIFIALLIITLLQLVNYTVIRKFKN